MNDTETDPAVDLRARVLAYIPNSLMDHFSDGSHRAFDATTLEILDPPALRHRRLTIHHDHAVAAGSPWRAVGSILRFAIDANLLDGGAEAFAAGTHNVRMESPT